MSLIAMVGSSDYILQLLNRGSIALYPTDL